MKNVIQNNLSKAILEETNMNESKSKALTLKKAGGKSAKWKAENFQKLIIKMKILM